MKKAIIHIGAHKTGSTAIQEILYDNSYGLAQQDIYYPLELTCEQAYFWGQHILIWSLMQAQVGSDFALSQHQIDQSLDVLGKITNRYSNIVLSSENFIRLDETSIFRLKDVLFNFDIYIVIYVRRQDVAALALYQTDVVNYKESKAFDDWFKNNRFLFDYLSIIKRWEAIAAKIIVRPYDRKLLNNNDVISDFQIMLENVFEQKISLDISKRKPMSNKTFPASITNIIRYYNSLPSGAKITPALKRLGYELNSLHVSNNFELVPPSIRQSILEGFYEGNIELSKKYLKQNEIWFDGIIKGNDIDWKDKFCFNGSDLSILVNEILEVIASFKKE